MYRTNLRKVGGSVMLAVPRAILEALDLHPGETVGVTVGMGGFTVQRQQGPHYTMDELLSQCDLTQPPTPEDQAWLDVQPEGKEL